MKQNRPLLNLARAVESSLARMALISKCLWIGATAIAVFLAFPPGAAVILAAVVWRFGRPQVQAGTTHGTARFASLRDVLHAGCLFQQSGVFMGKAISDRSLGWGLRVRAMLFSPWRHSNRAMQIATAGRSKATPLLLHTPIDKYPHTAIFGATGAGKSTSFAAQTLLLSGDSSCVVLDPKGELTRNFAEWREQRFGQSVILIDPFGVADGSGYEPHRLNPLDCFRGNDRQAIDNSRRLANEIVVRTGRESERFWTDAAAVLVTSVISFLTTMAKDGASLNHVRDITSSPEMLQQTLQMLLVSEKCDGMLRRLAGEVSCYEGKMGASVLSVANSNLAFLDSIPVSEVLGESTFDPDILLTGRATIFLCLPVDRLTEMAALQRVILSTLINRVFAAGEDGLRRIHFLLDEAATLGPMESLTNAVMFGRSFGLRMTFLFQSASQVEKCFPETQRNDFMATVSKIYAGSDDLATAKELSESCGTHSVWSSTMQTGTNSGRSTTQSMQDLSFGTNWGTNDSSSFAEQSRSLLTPAEILTLPRHMAIALLPGTPPVLLEKVPYYATQRNGRFKRLIRLFVNSFVVTTTALAIGALSWILCFYCDDPRLQLLLHELTSFWRPN